MKVVVDTNIIFSGLLNINGAIGELLINSETSFEFYSCGYMRSEIQKHWEKLKKVSDLSEQQLSDMRFYLFSRLKFIDENLIPETIWKKALKLTHDIDIDDTDFVALTLLLKAHYGPEIKAFITGLKRSNSKGFSIPLISLTSTSIKNSTLHHYFKRLPQRVVFGV